MSVFGSEVSGLLNARGAAFAALDARVLLTKGTSDFSQARAGSASFDNATMMGDLVLSEMAVTGTTSLRELELTGNLAMTRFLSGQLDMAIPLVDKVIGRPDQEAVLARIEATARAQKNNAKANEAEYRLLSLRGEAESGLSRIVDLVLYQWIAGYLVRPSHPLAALALLVLAGTVVSIVWRARADRERSKGLGQGLKAAGKATVKVGHVVGTWLNCFTTALAGTFRPKPKIEIPDDAKEEPRAYLLAGVQLFEYTAGKVLIIVFLLSMANYNDTLRQVIEGVIG
jgi:hypothetical protein